MRSIFVVYTFPAGVTRRCSLVTYCAPNPLNTHYVYIVAILGSTDFYLLGLLYNLIINGIPMSSLAFYTLYYLRYIKFEWNTKRNLRQTHLLLYLSIRVFTRLPVLSSFIQLAGRTFWDIFMKLGIFGHKFVLTFWYSLSRLNKSLYIHVCCEVHAFYAYMAASRIRLSDVYILLFGVLSSKRSWNLKVRVRGCMLSCLP